MDFIFTTLNNSLTNSRWVVSKSSVPTAMYETDYSVKLLSVQFTLNKKASTGRKLLNTAGGLNHPMFMFFHPWVFALAYHASIVCPGLHYTHGPAQILAIKEKKLLSTACVTLTNPSSRVFD